MSAITTKLKERGNDCFKKGNFAEAANLYSEAEEAAPQDAVYSSNLSAALYELGHYEKSLEALIRAVSKASRAGADASFMVRLATRMAKTLSHGVRGGVISTQQVNNASASIEEFRTVALASATDPTSELSRVWREWTRVESEAPKIAQGAGERRKKLSLKP